MPEAPPAPPAPTGRGRPRSVLGVLSVLVVLLLATGLGVYYFVWTGPVNVAPHVAKALGNGSAFFDLPFLMLYTAPPLAVKGFATSSNASYISYPDRPSANFTLTWSNVTGTSLPVVFSFTSSNVTARALTFVPGPDGKVRLLPAGVCTSPCTSDTIGYGDTNTGSMGVVAVSVAMGYNVTEMTSTVNSVHATWIQVAYTLTIIHFNAGVPPPFANATAPTPADLVPVGPAVPLSYPKGSSWSYDQNVHDLNLLSQSFANSLGPISIRTPGASLNTTLSCTFAWGPNSDYHIRLSGTNGALVTLQFYVDLRFGSLTVQYVP